MDSFVDNRPEACTAGMIARQHVACSVVSRLTNDIVLCRAVKCRVIHSYRCSESHNQTR